MNQYEILRPVTFKKGRFRLTDEQLRRRRHVVRQIDEHTVEPIHEISFKAGEIITTDLPMSKVLVREIRALGAAASALAAGNKPADSAVAESAA